MNKDIEEIAACLGLTAPSKSAVITSLLTDSRELDEAAGTLFFAIATRGNDGHRYVGDLYRRGVRNFVVTHIPEGMENHADANFLIVDDVVQALQRIATRGDSFPGQLLAITGSRGKTTLKEWLYQLMEPLGGVSRSPRSYNSQIGVPLSLWDITPEATLGIFEAGVSRPGEMDRLSRMIRPDIVVITNILDDHDDGFPSREAKMAEKVRLIHGAKTVIFNADDKALAHTIKSQAIGDQKLFGWSRTDRNAPLFVTTENTDAGQTIVTYTVKGQKPTRFRLPFTSRWHVENALTSLAVMVVMGIPASETVHRMATLAPVGTRLQVSEGINRCLIVRDDYTCDFHSLLPALDFLARRHTAGLRMTVVLSDIAHDGMSAEETYTEIGRLLRFRGVTRLLAGGKEISAYASKFAGLDATFFPSVNALYKAMTTSDFSSELVLIKGTPAETFDRFARQLEARTHETVLEVNLDAMVHNYNFFRSRLHPSTKASPTRIVTAHTAAT